MSIGAARRSASIRSFSREGAAPRSSIRAAPGPGNYPGFLEHVIRPSPVRIIALLNVSFAGIYGFSKRVMVGESGDLRLMAPIDAVEVALANRDTIGGIKVRVGFHASQNSGTVPLDIALKVAEEAGLPLMAHIDVPPPTLEEVLERLRPGDILTHCFRPFPNNPTTPEGGVRPAVLEARKRGVIFDIGHGMGSFAFKTARTMLANDFAPDCISSDVHALCIDGPAFDLFTTMSKFLCLGFPLADTVRAATKRRRKLCAVAISEPCAQARRAMLRCSNSKPARSTMWIQPASA